MLIIVLVISFVLGVALLIYLRWRDRRYIRQSTRAALGRELKEEIQTERDDYARHKAHFEKSLEKARQKKQSPS